MEKQECEHQCCRWRVSRILGYISHREVESTFLSPGTCTGPVTIVWNRSDTAYPPSPLEWSLWGKPGTMEKAWLSWDQHTSRTPSHLERCHGQRGQGHKGARLLTCEWRSILASEFPAQATPADAMKIRYRLPDWILPQILTPTKCNQNKIVVLSCYIWG